MLSMPGKSHTGALPAISASQAELKFQLEAHVKALAATPRHDAAGKNRARSYIRGQLPGTDFTTQLVDGAEPSWVNLETALSGSDETVVVAAHYDTVWTTPGADDNASGTAALIELVRMLQNQPHERTIRFVFLVNEEPPYFQRPAMGSTHYARMLKDRGENVTAMLSLETIGYYTDEPGSQVYPFPFSLFLPNTGNFIGFVGNTKSRRLTRDVVGSFRDHAQFPSIGVAAPEFIQGVTWSDQWSFWEQGYPGVMVTDTAPNRNPHYHEPTDTPDTLDYEAMARVVEGLAKVIEDLASE